MTEVEEICKAFRELTPDERTELLKQIGPELCSSMIAHPELMMQMMGQCQAGMWDSEFMKTMRPFFEHMMRGGMGHGVTGGDQRS